MPKDDLSRCQQPFSALPGETQRCCRIGCDNKWLFGEQPPICSRSSLAAAECQREFADSILRRAAETFKARNSEYGGNYRRMGTLILALFPGGFIPEVETQEQANRLNLIIDCLGKLQRYAHAFHKGGHKDSAHDLIVYAAMLEEMTDEHPVNRG